MKLVGIIAVLLGLFTTTVLCGKLTGTPVLQWKYGGCLTGGGTWCENGYYSSPYVGDFDKNGKVDVIFASYYICGINGTNGKTLWKFDTGKDITGAGTSSSIGTRTWSDVVVADLNGDGTNELITGHEGGLVSVYNTNLHFAAGWPKTIGSGEIRSVTAASLMADGTKSLLIGSTNSQPNTYIYNYAGTPRPGWPQQKANTKGYSAGIYNHNVAAFNVLASNSGLEIVAPSDVNYIMVYDQAGVPIYANGKVYKNNTGGAKTWGECAIFAKISDELQGWGSCTSTSGTLRPNLAGSRPTFSDVDRNGTPEILIVGNVYDCGKSDTDYLYYGPYIFNRDRTRFAPNSLHNWTNAPMNTGKVLYPPDNWKTIQDCQPNVVAADLDGDGQREFIHPDYTAQMKVYWLDKTIKYNWTKLNLGGEYPSEPIIVDFENDGKAEVIFATYPTQVAGHTGHFYICDYAGNVLYKVSLPAAPPEYSGGWNGVLAAPTIGNIDSDADLEVVLSTWSTGLIAYDLPGSAGARIIWGTGSLNYDRNPDEYVYSTKICNTCLNNCYTAQNCGTNTNCKTSCSNSCHSKRSCY